MAKRSAILLLAGYVGALAFIAYELQYTPPHTSGPAAGAEPSLPRLAPPVFDPGNPDDYRALVERPPFTRGRQALTKAPQPTDPGQKTTPGNLTTARLSAILVNGNKITAVVENGDGSSTRLQKGTRFEGWQVNDIRSDRVVLRLDNQRRELLVHRFDAPRPPPLGPAQTDGAKSSQGQTNGQPPRARRIEARTRRPGQPR